MQKQQSADMQVTKTSKHESQVVNKNLALCVVPYFKRVMMDCPGCFPAFCPRRGGTDSNMPL